MMKRIFAILVIFFVAVNLTGCDALQRKLTRKKKKEVKQPRIYQVKKYDIKPSPEMYHKHFAYWVSWQSELVQVLGNNHKKDVRCIEEILGNLRDMQNLLVEKKAKELEPHIKKMIDIKDIIFKENLTTANRDTIRSTLEREERFIKREFSTTRVKPYIKASFDEESQ